MNTVEYNLIRFTTISYNFNSFPSSLHSIKNILAFPRFIPSKHSFLFFLVSIHQKHSHFSSLHSTRTAFFSLTSCHQKHFFSLTTFHKKCSLISFHASFHQNIILSSLHSTKNIFLFFFLLLLRFIPLRLSSSVNLFLVTVISVNTSQP